MTPSDPLRGAPETAAGPHAVDAAAAVAFVVLWSSGFVGARLGADHAGPATLLAWRLLVSATLLMAWWSFRSARRPPQATTTGAVVQHAVIGVLTQAFYLGGVFGGVAAGVPAGTVALIAALQPLVVANASSRFLGERIDARQRTGLWLGISGVAVVVADGLGASDTPLWAYALPLGSMLALSAGTVLDRRWRPQGNALQAFTIHTVTAALLVTGLTGLAGELTPPESVGFWSAVAWTALLSGIGGYGMYVLVLRRRGATHVSVLLYLTPPTTLVWTWIMFGEGIGPRGLVGFIICAVAVYLVLRTPAQRRRRQRRRAAPPVPAAPPQHLGSNTVFLSSWWSRPQPPR